MTGEGTGPEIEQSDNDAHERADSNRFSPNHSTGQMDSHADDPIDEWQLVNSVRYTNDEHSDLTVATVYAIAEARDVDPTDLNSLTLYECIDVSAVERVFDLPEPAPDSTVTGQIEFRYDELRIVVDHDGHVMVYEPDG